ncbi:MAG: hypothetical protein A2297_05095 [Elusimicrobia bacterium RIFOXYB2_FULL_48_7]|nr:MAG: hypothetical protein A2297_05095 [Elusimicrobia bacterium RIFOXYB2_FULL_48_7]
MKNPFIYGKIVTGESFVNRQKEKADLTKYLLDNQVIFLISSRRYGKSSLLKKVSEELKKKKAQVAYIDLFKCSSLEQFVAQYARVLASLETSVVEKAVKLIGEWVSALRPQFTIDKDGTIGLEIDAKPREQEVYQLLEKLMEKPQEYAKKHKCPVIIMIDEFQEIVRFGGEQLEKYLRAVIQGQKNVGYVFSGSKRSMLTDMVSKKSRAFYHSGPVMYLDKIGQEEWIRYIKDKFRKSKIAIDDAVVIKIIQKAQNIPYYVQSLSHKTWELTLDSRKVNEKIIEEAVESIVDESRHVYVALWEMLPSTQQRLLEGIARGAIENPLSQDFIIRHQMNSRSTVTTSLKLLEKKDILERSGKKYIFCDIWFSEWILKR